MTEPCPWCLRPIDDHTDDEAADCFAEMLGSFLDAELGPEAAS